MIFNLKNKWVILSLSLALVPTLVAEISVADELSKGIGPTKEVKLEKIDLELAIGGKKIFESKCMVCHKIAEKYTGPALKGVTKRRAPEWIMNMILNPSEMVDNDPTAQELLGEYYVKMPFMDITQENARSILEYFRYYDENGEIQNVPIKTEIKKTEKKKKK